MLSVFDSSYSNCWTYTFSYQQAYTWEASFARSWETVQEDEGGSLQVSVEDLMARGRRRRSVICVGRIASNLMQHLLDKIARPIHRCSSYHYTTFGSRLGFVFSHDGPGYATDKI